MKRVYTFLAVVVLTATLWAQSPEKMSYQAVIHNSSDALVTNTNIGMQISILQGSASGTAVYIEQHFPTTNSNGLVTIEIGGGSVISGVFSNINWGTDTYFIKTETDLNGSTNYTITGTSQLLSVPYALHAKTAESFTGATTLTVGQSYQGGIIFWLDATGQHGLIAATTDQSSGIQWYNGTYRYTGTAGDGLYSGAMNTTMIIAEQIADNQTGNFAAKVCADYSVTVSGVTYGDWYLPSEYELSLLYLQRTVVGGFASANYWSSTESTNERAYVQYFPNDIQGTNNKVTTARVRAIRAF
ncbi:DUF1566 domain-containing protein [Flavobacteriaceae bacterium XHP0103]|uniref:DUF1566 domain-containing protein n=1 Tax=Marixanthotalea marina TaxID=2844359 RepID=UPI002989FCE8|nr:DUF1566 domain-containing protein [Marixanthotalea marina]MBU3820774.1 DUF1566 domain-containing protein [Marixanthotalea marina]